MDFIITQWEGQTHSCGILAKNVEADSSCEEIALKPKLKDILQNNWLELLGQLSQDHERHGETTEL